MLKTNRLFFTLYMLYAVLAAGCAAINPVAIHYENTFSDFRAPLQNLTESGSIKRDFNKPFDEVWKSTLDILAQHTIIIDASREPGMITFVIIDGVYFGDVFREEDIYYWEFPFAVFMSRGSNGVTVSIHPMKNLYDDKYKKRNWWKTVDAGFNQNGEEIMERLSTQLTAQERWPWLIRVSTP